MPETQDAETPPANRPRRKAKPVPLLLTAATVVYVVFLLSLTGINATGPDLWWWGSLNLYLPQWLWLIPGAVLLPAYLIWARRRIWVALLCVLWAAGPIMGFCWHFGGGDTSGTKLRVMTYNVKMGRHDLGAILRDAAENNPDIILFQESTRWVSEAMSNHFPGWDIRQLDQYLIATKLPVLSSEPRWIAATPNDSRIMMRYQVQVGDTLLTIFNAHLLSPRRGLAILHSRNEQGREGLEGNVDVRLSQAKLLADLVRKENGATLVCGDLNAPVQSLVCRTFFDTDLRDAFSEAGKGYGYSYGQKIRHMPFAYVRIDHILFSKEFHAVNAWAGNTEGSEHRPVFADLTLTKAAR